MTRYFIKLDRYVKACRFTHLFICLYRVPDATGGAAGFNGKRQNNSRGTGSVIPSLLGENATYCKTIFTSH